MRTTKITMKTSRATCEHVCCLLLLCCWCWCCCVVGFAVLLDVAVLFDVTRLAVAEFIFQKNLKQQGLLFL